MKMACYQEALVFVGADGNQYTFKVEINPANGGYMFWLERDGRPYGGMCAGSLKDGKTMSKAIRDAAIKVISHEVYKETKDVHIPKFS